MLGIRRMDSSPLFPNLGVGKAPGAKSSTFPVSSDFEPVRDHPGVGGFSFSFDAKIESVSISVPPKNIEDAFSSDEEARRNSSKRKEKEQRRRPKRKKRQIQSSSSQKSSKVDREKNAPMLDLHATNNPKCIFFKDAGVTVSNAFCIDMRPDSHNFAFDETYWKNVPKFRKPPRLVLGDSLNGKSKRKPDPRYFELTKELEIMNNTPGVHVKGSDDIVPFGRNYLPLPEHEDNPRVEVIENTLECDATESGQARTKYYNGELQRHPTNIPLWLEFIRFQDEVAKLHFAGTKDSSRSNNAGLLQRKVAILERAIEHNQSSVELRLRRLSMCEDIWEKDQLSSEWRKLAFDHPNNPYVWKAYLFFLQSYFPVFVCSGVTKAYQKYISVSLSISEGQFQSHPAIPFHLEHVIFLSSFITSFLMESGHQEKAIAFQQALLELNLNFPKNLSGSIPLKDALLFLEPFWDSGVPRIGEKGAIGWGEVMESKAVPVTSDSEILEETENLTVRNCLSAVELWPKLEDLRSYHCLLPYHGTEDPVDPERLIIFDDISPYIFRIKEGSENRHLTFLMVTNFLTILHCWMPRMFSTKSYGWRALFPTSLGNPLSSLFCNWTESHCNLSTSDNCSHMVFDSFQKTWSDKYTLIDGIFTRSLEYFSGLHQTYLSISWLQNMLSKYYTSEQTKKALAAKEVRNLAKSLLKKPENRSNLLIWEWYAFCENTLELNETVGLSILDTVLSSVKPDLEDPNIWITARLIRFYVELTLGILYGRRSSSEETASERKNALRVLVQFAEGSLINSSDSLEIPSNRILKCRKSLKHLQELRPASYTARVYAFGSFSNITICFGLFEYLTNGFDSAVTVYQDAIESCKAKVSAMDSVDFASELEMVSMDCEILTEGLVRLAYYHQRNSYSSMPVFRGLILDALKDFPSNPALLGQFVQSEMMLFVSGRLRTYFETAVKDAEDAMPWLFAIFAEYERKYRLLKNWSAACSKKIVDDVSLRTLKDTGIAHKLRALFERAAESDSARHCPLIWQLYLKFEMENENLLKAEAIYFRAIQSCPWSKDVFLNAIKFFPHRTQEIIDVMTEKELRVFTLYEEVILLIKSKNS